MFNGGPISPLSGRVSGFQSRAGADSRRHFGDHPGFDALNTASSLHTAFYVLDQNYVEPKRILDLYANEDVALQLMKESSVDFRGERIDWIMREATRTVLNYTSSAMAIVPHMRNIMRRTFDGHELVVEYEAAAKRRFETPLPQFVQALRNYVVHRELPTVAASIQVENDK